LTAPGRIRVLLLGLAIVAGLLSGAGRPAGAVTTTATGTSTSTSASNESITVDGSSPGRAFDGVGAISGGGGNSRVPITLNW
jgi:hypothetical protein